MNRKHGYRSSIVILACSVVQCFIVAVREVLKEPVVYVLYVCKECILSLSVYECRNKAKREI